MWGILFWTKDGSHFGNFNMARYCIYMGRDPFCTLHLGSMLLIKRQAPVVLVRK